MVSHALFASWRLIEMGLAKVYDLASLSYPPVQVAENVVPLTMMTIVVACAYARVHVVCHPVMPV